MPIRRCFICGTELRGGDPYGAIVYKFFPQEAGSTGRREAVIAHVCDRHRDAEVEIKAVTAMA